MPVPDDHCNLLIQVALFPTLKATIGNKHSRTYISVELVCSLSESLTSGGQDNVI